MGVLERNGSCESMAGIASVEFINERYGRVMLSESGERVRVVTSEGWNRIYVRQKEADYEGRSADGNSFRNEVKVVLRGTSNNYTRLLEKMKQKRWLVRLTDSNGIMWLVGDNRSPMRFEYDHVNTGGASGVRNYELRFFCTSRDEARQFELADIEAEVPNLEAGVLDEERFKIVDGYLVVEY